MLGSVRKHQFGGEAPAKRRRYDEAGAQARVVAWLRGRDWCVMMLENARVRKYGAARDKALGLRVGAPDLILVFRRQVVFLEMKSTTGKLDREQEQLHTELRARGQTVIVAYGYEDAIKQLERVERDYAE